MNRWMALLVVAVGIASPAAAAAQPPSERWQVAGGGAWVGADTPSDGQWKRWFGGASADVEVTRFWTPHVFTGVRGGAATRGEAHRLDPLDIPGATFPTYRHSTRRYGFVDATFLAGYRFLQNEWVHPYVAAGVRLERVTREEITPAQTVPLDRTFGRTIAIPARSERLSPLVRALPIVDGGFDFYASERAFVRSSLFVAFDQGMARLGWRAAVGLDF